MILIMLSYNSNVDVLLNKYTVIFTWYNADLGN